MEIGKKIGNSVMDLISVVSGPAMGLYQWVKNVNAPNTSSPPSKELLLLKKVLPIVLKNSKSTLKIQDLLSLRSVCTTFNKIIKPEIIERSENVIKHLKTRAQIQSFIKNCREFGYNLHRNILLAQLAESDVRNEDLVEVFRVLTGLGPQLQLKRLAFIRDNEASWWELSRFLAYYIPDIENLDIFIKNMDTRYVPKPLNHVKNLTLSFGFTKWNMNQAMIFCRNLLICLPSLERLRVEDMEDANPLHDALFQELRNKTKYDRGDELSLAKVPSHFPKFGRKVMECIYPLTATKERLSSMLRRQWFFKMIDLDFKEIEHPSDSDEVNDFFKYMAKVVTTLTLKNWKGPLTPIKQCGKLESIKFVNLDLDNSLIASANAASNVQFTKFFQEFEKLRSVTFLNCKMDKERLTVKMMAYFPKVKFVKIVKDNTSKHTKYE